MRKKGNFLTHDSKQYMLLHFVLFSNAPLAEERYNKFYSHNKRNGMGKILRFFFTEYARLFIITEI